MGHFSQNNFCAGFMLIQPSQAHFHGLMEHARGMERCYGDQGIVATYFAEEEPRPDFSDRFARNHHLKPRALKVTVEGHRLVKTFPTSLVNWEWCDNPSSVLITHAQKQG